MEDIKDCKCETTVALISKDTAKLEKAIQFHNNHLCPNYGLAVYYLFKMKCEELMSGCPRGEESFLQNER